MKNTVLIIAHNEEKNIELCIKSILNQTVSLDRIVLIVHNCTDNTISKAKDFKEVEIFECNEGDAPIYARIEALKHINENDENIFCIDGDAIAKNNWIKELSLLLEENILVGSLVVFKGSIFESFSNITNYIFCVKGNPNRWIWGASFAFHAKDINFIKDILEKSIRLKKDLNLSRFAEDFWLALFLQGKGKLEITNKTNITVVSKESSLLKSISRNRENARNGNKMRKYFNLTKK